MLRKKNHQEASKLHLWELHGCHWILCGQKSFNNSSHWSNRHRTCRNLKSTQDLLKHACPNRCILSWVSYVSSFHPEHGVIKLLHGSNHGSPNAVHETKRGSFVQFWSTKNRNCPDRFFLGNSILESHETSDLDCKYVGKREMVGKRFWWHLSI